jgi:hypothetical protein
LSNLEKEFPECSERSPKMSPMHFKVLVARGLDFAGVRRRRQRNIGIRLVIEFGLGTGVVDVEAAAFAAYSVTIDKG